MLLSNLARSATCANRGGTKPWISSKITWRRHRREVIEPDERAATGIPPSRFKSYRMLELIADM
jgi:hypothetical protein